MWSDKENYPQGSVKPTQRLHTVARKHLHWTLLSLFLVAIFIAVVVTGVLFHQNDVKNAARHSLSGNTGDNLSPIQNPSKSDTNIFTTALVNLNDFDPSNGVSYTVLFQSFFNTASGNPPADSGLEKTDLPLACVFADDYSAGDLVGFLEINPVQEAFQNKTGGLNASADGFLSQYPFDEYTVQILIGSFAVGSQGVATADSTCDNFTQTDIDTLIPFQVDLGQSLPGFSATFTLKPDRNDPEDPTSDIIPNNYILELTFKRDGIIKFFAVIMFIVVWLLTIIVIIATGQVIMYHMEPRFELVGASTALLFALPQIRQSQPGMPATPTISDTVGYYWAIALLGLSTFALIWHSIWQLRVDRHQTRHQNQTPTSSQWPGSGQPLQTSYGITLPRSGTVVSDDGYNDYKAPINGGFAPNR